MKVIDLVGKQFGSLLVERRSNKNSRFRQPLWHCICNCGNKVVVLGQSLRTGHSTSCGCRTKEIIRQKAKIHGKSNTPEHKIWLGMLSRCNDQGSNVYRYYGGLGISICDRWQFGENGKHGFECFLEDVGPKPSSNHSIDRIDPFGNYEPANCRWVTQLQQMNNRRNTRWVIYRGKEMALCDAVRAAGNIIHYEAAWIRISKCGWTVSDAIETPRLHLSPNSNERRQWAR